MWQCIVLKRTSWPNQSQTQWVRLASRTPWAIWVVKMFAVDATSRKESERREMRAHSPAVPVSIKEVTAKVLVMLLQLQTVSKWSRWQMDRWALCKLLDMDMVARHMANNKLSWCQQAQLNLTHMSEGSWSRRLGRKSSPYARRSPISRLKRPTRLSRCR